MLATQTLWFAKAAKLDDAFEAFCKVALIPGLDYADPLGPEGTRTVSLEEVFAKFRWLAAQSCENAREHLYVNSWCADRTESMAMWQLFGSGKYGIAVKSSVSRYGRSAKFDVDRRTHCQFGKVKYHDDIESAKEIVRDFSKGSIPASSNLWASTLALGFHKRSAYRYENEWRAALYQDFRPDVVGITVAFDLHTLIDEVLINPWAEPFFQESVQAVMQKFELDRPLNRSRLLEQPAQSN